MHTTFCIFVPCAHLYTGRFPCFLSTPIWKYRAIPGGSERRPALIAFNTLPASRHARELNNGCLVFASKSGPNVAKTSLTSGYNSSGGGIVLLQCFQSHVALYRSTSSQDEPMESRY